MSDERLQNIETDVAYIKGEIKTLVNSCEARVNNVEGRATSLEESIRNQNIFVVLYGAVIGVIAWIGGKS